MREFKFRAWDKEENKMIEWFPEFFSDMSPVTRWSSEIEQNDIILMQYTGLKDDKRTTEYPKGQEIYDGDIIRVVALSNDHNQKGATTVLVVKYFMGNPCLCESKYVTGTPIYPFCVNHTLEVIGNIYENPELLTIK